MFESLWTTKGRVSKILAGEEFFRARGGSVPLNWTQAAGQLALRLPRPSREGPTAKSWMLARLIAAGLAQRLVQPYGPLSPWGYELRSKPQTASSHA